MNVMNDNIDPKRNEAATNKPMVVKSTKMGRDLMPPPSCTAKGFVTPSTSRYHPNVKDSSTSSRTKTPSTSHQEAHVIAALCEGRGKASGIVGIAAINIHHPILILSQISDTQNYTLTLTKLNILGPVELIVPATFVEGASTSRIISMIVNQFPNLTMNTVPRSEFNRGRGLHMIRNICASGFSAVIVQVEPKFYTLAASCALLKYIEQSRRVSYSAKTLKVEYQEPEFTTAIDIDTAMLLGLTSSKGKQNVSLFSVINYCSTKPGKKLLRTNILQPPCRSDIIQTRLDCIQELLENPNLLIRLQETLRPLSDIESSLTFATILPSEAAGVSEKQLNYTLQLKGLLNAVQPLADELKASRHPVFRNVYNRIEGLDTRKKIIDLINEIINEDAHLAKGQAGELQRCFAIKSGINGFLDLSRRLYTEGVNNMRAYVENLSETYNLPLRVQHTIKNGFHITLPLTKALRNLKRSDLPKIFTKVERFNSHFYLTTMDMINYDRRLKNNSIEIQNIGNVIIYQLLISIRPYISDLYNLCDDIAQLDMLVSLTRASSLPNWVRPKIVENYMNVEGVRHPILEHVAHQDPVCNSVFCLPRSPLHIITGPNMSGKTILLHSICLTQILFQLGSYVPCSEASLRVAQRVYARVADDDELTLQASSFTLEMAKIAYLVSTVNEKSLVVLDEICRTTGCDEGAMLAFALCEKLIKVGCFTFVGTHFQVLTLMEDLYPSVTNWHLETIEENRANNNRISLKFTYKLLPGVTTIERYGIKLSRIFQSSESISDRAEVLYNFLEPLGKSLVPKSVKALPDYMKHKLQAELDLLKIKNQLTDAIQKNKIADFHTKTGLTFEPSPISFERSSSILNQSSSKNKTSSKSSSKQKVSSDSKSSIPPSSSSKSDNSSSNHKFSVPSSSKSQEGNKNNDIFSCDEQEIQEKDSYYSNCDTFENMESFKSQDVTVSSVNDELCPIHKMLSTGTSENRNFFIETSNDVNDKIIPVTGRFDQNQNEESSYWLSAEDTLKNKSVRSFNRVVNSSFPENSSENGIPVTKSISEHNLVKKSKITMDISAPAKIFSASESSQKHSRKNITEDLSKTVRNKVQQYSGNNSEKNASQKNAPINSCNNFSSKFSKKPKTSLDITPVIQPFTKSDNSSSCHRFSVPSSPKSQTNNSSYVAQEILEKSKKIPSNSETGPPQMMGSFESLNITLNQQNDEQSRQNSFTGTNNLPNSKYGPPQNMESFESLIITLPQQNDKQSRKNVFTGTNNPSNSKTGPPQKIESFESLNITLPQQNDKQSRKNVFTETNNPSNSKTGNPQKMESFESLNIILPQQNYKQSRKNVFTGTNNPSNPKSGPPQKIESFESLNIISPQQNDKQSHKNVFTGTNNPSNSKTGNPQKMESFESLNVTSTQQNGVQSRKNSFTGTNKNGFLPETQKIASQNNITMVSEDEELSLTQERFDSCEATSAEKTDWFSAENIIHNNSERSINYIVDSASVNPSTNSVSTSSNNDLKPKQVILEEIPVSNFSQASEEYTTQILKETQKDTNIKNPSKNLSAASNSAQKYSGGKTEKKVFLNEQNSGDNFSNASCSSWKNSQFQSAFDFDSPILSKKRKLSFEKTNMCPVQTKLVSDLYDSSDSEEEILEINTSNDSVIINEDDDVNNEANSEIYSLDESNFSSYLNMKKGFASTPIRNQKYDSSLEPESVVLGISSSKSDVDADGDSQKFKETTKKSSSDNTSYESCVSSRFSNFSTDVIIGQNCNIKTKQD